MMTMKKLKINRILGLGIIFFALSCTDLDEEVYDTILNEDFFKTKEEFIAALGQAYSSFGGLGNSGNLFSINELGSDELVVATKGGDWYDGGVLIQIRYHKFAPDSGLLNNACTQIYGGINNCDRLIYQ